MDSREEWFKIGIPPGTWDDSRLLRYIVDLHHLHLNKDENPLMRIGNMEYIRVVDP
jgi:hypothetical protein